MSYLQATDRLIVDVSVGGVFTAAAAAAPLMCASCHQWQRIICLIISRCSQTDALSLIIARPWRV